MERQNSLNLCAGRGNLPIPSKEKGCSEGAVFFFFAKRSKLALISETQKEGGLNEVKAVFLFCTSPSH